MKSVDISHFTKYKSLHKLRSNNAGQFAFMVKQPNLKENCYDNNLWLNSNGKTSALAASCNVQDFWWQGTDEIVFACLRAEKDKAAAKKGLPLTVLHRISTLNAGEAAEWQRLNYNISELVFLDKNRFLFIANYHPDIDAILQNTANANEAIEKISERQEYEIVSETPFWEDGAGYTSGWRQKLFLWDNGKISKLTSNKYSVEELQLAPSKEYAFFTCAHFNGNAMDLYKQLFRLNLHTLALEDFGIQQPFQHSSFAVFSNNEIIAAGSTLKPYGINQNNNFYHLNGAKHKLLASGGAYCLCDSVNSDIKHSFAANFTVLGRKMYFISTINENCHLMCIDADSGIVKQLTKTSGTVLEFAVNEKEIIFTALRALKGTEIYQLSLNGKEKTLTNFNSHLHKDYHLINPEEIQFTNANNSLIQGWVMRPAGFNANKKYPAILYIHGGPKTAYGSIMFHEMQYLAHLGYAVLFCNPTGSDGRGDDFADIRGRYGSVDFEDILQFLSSCLSKNTWINAEKVGIIGGSYGGFMVNWAIGHTKQFAAAISQRGISNWVSMGLTSDIGHIFQPDQTAANIWKDTEAVWSNSPLKYAPQVQTPTLFMHSSHDYRCPLNEGLQMYTALQIHNVPTRMCIFHGESHGLSRGGSPKQRVRRLQEITNWFNKYLMPNADF